MAQLAGARDKDTAEMSGEEGQAGDEGKTRHVEGNRGFEQKNVEGFTWDRRRKSDIR
jgi:hypothetical protein